MIARASNSSDFNLIYYPNPLLRNQAMPVTKIDEDIIRLSEKMIDIMVENNGVGLAAPQLGCPFRIIVVSPGGTREEAQVLINPELNDFNGWSEMEEGCLSIPDVRGKVRRAAACILKAQDLDGNQFTVDAVDFYAVILQHETDHLNGKLFIDRLNTLSRLAVNRKLKLLEYTQKQA